jgi:single stranded DNA-binding protein
MGQEKRENSCLIYSVTITGFVGADPEQRQARNNNGSKFTVLSVATQRSWKNTDDEWASKTEWHRVCVFRPRLAEYVATTIKKGSHVLVEGSLVSTTYERNGEWKKSGGKPPHSKGAGIFSMLHGNHHSVMSKSTERSGA